jgi:hypothetical protein
MAAGQQAFLSTPTFELFRRGLLVQTIQQFHGINAFSSLPLLGPDWAQDLNNVIVSGSGSLQKFRLPVKLSAAIAGMNSGPNSFWDFQQATGLRQVIAQFGESLYYYTNDLAAVTLIETNPQDIGQWSFVEANNILFGTNTLRAMKWLGAVPAGSTAPLWENWGIQPAATPPTVSTNTSNAQDITGVLLDGSTAYVQAPLVSYPSFPKIFSWEIWFKTTAAVYQGIFGLTYTPSGGAYDRIAWMDSAGFVHFSVLQNGTTNYSSIGSTAAFNDGNWHQLCITLDANRVGSMYIDGALQVQSNGQMVTSLTEPNHLTYWVWGAANGPGFPTNSFFSGDLSHASWWYNTVLTAAKFASHYSDFTTGSQAIYEAAVLADSPTSSWWMKDVSGPTAVDSADGNNGTYEGTFTYSQSSAIAGGITPTYGYEYGYAFENSTTVHVGNVSPASSSSGPLSHVTFVAQAQPPNPADAQIDTIVWFRTQDGGGDLFRLCSVNLATGAVTTYGTNSVLSAQLLNGSYLQLTDASPDVALDTTTLGPLINNPPLLGNYLATGQSRVFIANLIGAPQDIIYSGYEQILLGRPEESFPPNNRLRLSIGAETLAGIGVIHAGVVAFSQTGRMYMLRGAVEDISLEVPIAFTSYLEELPWTLGCFSHFAIKSTPYGLIWLAGDKTVQLFDGHNPPVDLSQGIYPYLRRITPGTEAQTVAAYYNWLDRDWYTLLVCTDGSLTPNRLFTFALNISRSEGLNTIQSVEAFISDVPNVLPGGASWVGLLTTSKLQRILCLASGGYIQQLPVSPDTQNGLTQDYTINPATTGQLNAFWKGGYSGNDSPQRSKMWRWARLATDQGGFQLMAYMVDDEGRKFINPEIIGPMKVEGRTGINNRAKRMAIEILFPPQDAPANVLELQVAQVPTADR